MPLAVRPGGRREMLAWLAAAAMAQDGTSCGRALCGAVLRADRYESVYDREIRLDEVLEIPLDAAPRLEIHADPARADRVTVELRTRSAVVLDAGGWPLALDGFHDAWSDWVAVAPMDGAWPLGAEPEVPRPTFVRAELVDAAARRLGPDGVRWDEVAADCDPAMPESGGACFFARVGGEVRVTAWRGDEVVQQVVVRMENPVGC